MRSASFTGAFYSQVLDFAVDSVRTTAISYMYFANPLFIRATSHLHQHSLATQVVRTIRPTALKLVH
jgi:hypothetical protein